MRLENREIKEYSEIIDVLKRANTIRLGIHNEPYPYVVPLSFGFEEKDGEIVLYIHGAKEGFKHTLLEKNKNVCVEADIFHRCVETGSGITVEYESIIGFGEAILIDADEAVKGLDLLCSYYGYDGFEYNKSVLEHMRVYKIVLKSITGKRRFV